MSGSGVGSGSAQQIVPILGADRPEAAAVGGVAAEGGGGLVAGGVGVVGAEGAGCVEGLQPAGESGGEAGGVPAQGTLREHREAADGSEAKGLSGMSVADGRTGARWRAAGRGQAGVRPDCAPGGQQACQEGHSSLDLGLAASWNGFRRPGWRQISGIRPHLGPIGDRCSSGWAPCAALVRYPG